MKKTMCILLALIITLQLASPLAFAAPQQYTTVVTFGESTNSSRSQVVSIKDLGEVVSVVPNTGSATFSKSGENVTVNVSGGSSTRYETYTPSSYGYETLTNSSNSFPSSYYYSSGGYSGSISKSGGAYTYESSPASTITSDLVTVNNTQKVTFSWNKDAKVWWISSPGSGQLPSSRWYSKNGYSGNIPKIGGAELNDPWDSVTSPGSPGATKTVNWYWEGYYQGDVSRPAVMGYAQDYSGTVYGSTEYTFYYAYSVTVTYTKKVSIPTTPTFNNITSNQINVNWTANGNDAGTTYQLYSNNTGAIIYNGTSTSFLHTGLSINTLYTYKVKAISPSGVESVYSAESSVSTLAVDPLPDGFDNLTHNSVRLRWLHNGNPTDSEYKYIVKNAGTTTVVKSGWGTGLSASATGLTPNTEYDLFVKVRNKNGIESPNEVYLGKTYTLSSVPTSLNIHTPKQTTLTIAWNNNLNPAGTIYQLYNINSGSIIYEGSNLTYVHSGLTQDTVYTYKVRSVNANVIPSGYTANVSKITLPHTIVSEGISNITASSMTGTISSQNTSSGTSYYYEISDEFGAVLQNSGWITSLSKTFGGLQPNKRYSVLATVKNDSGSLSRITIGTKATLPNVPGKPSLMGGTTRLQNIVGWSSSGNPAGTFYELQIKPLGGVYTSVFIGTQQQFTHNFNPWNSFYYKVRARNLDGSFSDFSPEFFYTDVVKPIGQSISIDGGASYTKNKEFSLWVSAIDDLSGVVMMRFKTGGSPFTAWIPYANSYYYSPTSAYVNQGTVQIIAEFKDLAGNISNPIADTIVHDDIAPMGSLTYPQYIITEEDITISAEAFDINPTSADTISGLRNVRFRELNKGIEVKPWGAWETFATSKYWSFEPGDGLKEVEMQISDNAGNISTTKLAVVMDTLFIHKAEFTDIVNAPLNNPPLPTSSLVNIKKGYNFTIMVETMGSPDSLKYGFNGQLGDFVKIEDNLFKVTLKVNKDDPVEKGVLPINIIAKRTSDGASKQTTLKVNVIGTAYDDFGVNNTN